MLIKVTKLFLVIFFVNTQLSYSQNSILIHFDQLFQSAQKGGYSFTKLMKLDADKLVYSDGNPFEIIFPKEFNVIDTAISLNYFTGWKNAKIENQTLFLIGNYFSCKPIVYVDYNHNLDFSDDGQPVVFSLDSTAVIYLKNSENASAVFPMNLFYPKVNPKMKKQIELMYSMPNSDSKVNKNLDVDHWMGERRMNIKTTNTFVNGKRIKLGLFDYNCNGLYNDKGDDRILIGDYEKNNIYGQLDKGAVVYSDSSLLEINGQVYKVDAIDELGQNMQLRKSALEYNKIKVGDNISDIEIELLSGKVKTLSDLQEKDKFLLLDFWGSWCKGCTQQLPRLKELQNSNSDKLQVIGLNYADNKTKMKHYIEKYNLKWINGFATQEIIDDLSIDAFPTFMLLNKKGEIVLMKGNLDEILERIK